VNGDNILSLVKIPVKTYLIVVIMLRIGTGRPLGNEFSVYVKIEAGCNALKIDEYLLFKHVLVNKYLAAVKTAGIILGYVRNVNREGIAYVRVVRSIISLAKIALPAARNRDFAKFGVTQQLFLGHVGKRGIKLKIPIAAQRNKIMALVSVIRSGRGFALIRNKISSGLFAINVQMFETLMIV
jgi:hypothetical protein